MISLAQYKHGYQKGIYDAQTFGRKVIESTDTKSITPWWHGYCDGFAHTMKNEPIDEKEAFLDFQDMWLHWEDL